MNRSDRRKARKAKPGLTKLSYNEQLQRLLKNGITPADLKHEYQRGRDDAIDDALEFYMRMTYAATALALKRELKFDHECTIRILRAMDRIIINEFTSGELIDRVVEECGLTLYFEEKKNGDDLFDV